MLLGWRARGRAAIWCFGVTYLINCVGKNLNPALPKVEAFLRVLLFSATPVRILGGLQMLGCS